MIMDLHSRRVIGWAFRNRMKRDLAIRSLKMAIAFRLPPEGCIHHTVVAAYIAHTITKSFFASMGSRYNDGKSPGDEYLGPIIGAPNRPNPAAIFQPTTVAMPMMTSS